MSRKYWTSFGRSNWDFTIIKCSSSEPAVEEIEKGKEVKVMCFLWGNNFLAEKDEERASPPEMILSQLARWELNNSKSSTVLFKGDIFVYWKDFITSDRIIVMMIYIPVNYINTQPRTTWLAGN